MCHHESCKLVVVRSTLSHCFLGLRDGQCDFEQIILSTWAFSVDAASVFAEAIGRLTQLKSAILSDIIAGRPEAEGLRVYEVLGSALKDKSLTEIDLSDNAVGPKGIAACRELLSGQEKLYFCNCGISAEAAKSLSDLLLFRSPTQ
jgi:Ran GTPase-activating protein 1